MPPKANNNRPTRRGTRSSTHAGDATPVGSNARFPSVARRAAEEAESRNRGEKVIDAIMNVRQTNPAGLSAAHASAVYGTNTYSVDAGSSSDSKVFKAVDEAAEDEAFEAQIFGTKKKKKTAMGRSSSRSLRKAMSDAVADMTTHKTKPDIDHANLNPVDTTDAAADHDHFDDDWEKENHGRRADGQELVRGPLGLARPPLDPSRPPHLSGNRNNYAGQAADRKSSGNTFLDPGNATYNGLRPPSEPPSSLRSKYGIPTGRASSEPYSPGRPDTSRSFIQESDLYGDASVHTPAPITNTKKQFKPSPLGLSNDVADDAASTSKSSPVQPKKPPPQQVGQSKSPGSQWPWEKKKPESLTTSAQEKTRKPIVGPHTPHIPHLGDKLSPPPSLGFPVEVTGGGRPEDIADQQREEHEEHEDVTELRNRMRYQKQPIVNGPTGVPVLTTQNVTRAEQKEVSELRHRLQNPNVVSAALGKAPRPVYHDPLPTTQHPVSPTTGSHPTTISSPGKQVPTSKATQETGLPVHQGTPSVGKKPVRVPVKTTHSDPTPMSGPGSAGPRTPVPSSRSWWQLPQMLWPIPLDILKDFLKLFLIFGATVLALMFCIQLASKAIQGVSDINVGDYTSDSGIWDFWPSARPSLPSLPSFTHFIPEVIKHPLQSLGDSDARSLFDRLNKFESKLGQLGDIVTELPSTSYLNVDKKGNVQVPEDFWHAVKDRIQAETGTAVNLREDNGQLPPYFWSAFKRILDSEKAAPTGSPSTPSTPGTPGTPSTSGTPFNMDEVEALMDKKLRNGWESWLRQNTDTVSKILGPNMTKELPVKTEKELKAHLEKLVKSGGGNVVVTQEQFAKQLQKELETHKTEFNKELRDIKERNDKISQALANSQNAPPQGMSRQEIKNLVDQWAKKAVANAKFEAMAQTGIKSRLDDHLANQVNFFAQGSGAVIDPTYTSNMWKIPPNTLKSKAWLQKDGYKSQPALVALQHWTDEGQCFCTGGDRNTLSVLLSREITPQHLVVEHILPGATLDPEAMPREIEVWAYFEELNLRATVSSWSAAQFPDTPEEKTLNAGFVKIGHFVFRQQNTGSEMQLFKLSSELAGFEAITHHVVVRAVSNYGADHTCFYRLRLFGDVRQEDMDKEKKR